MNEFVLQEKQEILEGGMERIRQGADAPVTLLRANLADAKPKFKSAGKIKIRDYLELKTQKLSQDEL